MLFFTGDDDNVMARYRQYIEGVKAALPAAAYEYALADWHYDFYDHRCPHDAWIITCEVKEYPPGGSQVKTVGCTLTLLGAYHDLLLTFKYGCVHSYNLALPQLSTSGNRAHGDWLIDEISLSERGLTVHEIQFSSGGEFKIESSEFEIVISDTGSA